MSESLLGEQLDEYRLLSLLGQGGMARVYRAIDVRLKRYVAIKVIDAPFRTDSHFAIRFEREARAIGQLEHTHIVRLYRYGEAKGTLYMAMEYIDGASLDKVLHSYQDDGEFIELQEAARIVREICLALDYAHASGVIHRDVKPSNIMLDKRGRAILTDFGLALLTEIGTLGEVLGTPHYVAPEQAISSAGALPQSDLYSLGVILYLMLTGRLPFDAEDSLEVALLHTSAPVPPPRQVRPDLSPELEAVILKSLSKTPEERYPTGLALADALDEALAARPAKTSSFATAPRLSVPERVAESSTRSPLPPIQAALAVTPTPPDRLQPDSSQPTRPTPGAPAETTLRQAIKRPLLYLLVLAAAAFLLLLSGAAGLLALRETGEADQQLETKDVWGSGLALVTAENRAQAPDLPPTPTLMPVESETSPAGKPVTPTMPPIVTIPGTETPTASPEPTATEQAPYELQFVKNGEDSLFILNLSSEPFPLDQLRLGSKGDLLEGSAWEVEDFFSGACVTLWKAKGNPRPPEVICEQVGRRLTLDRKELFWDRDFDVYFGPEAVLTCKKSEATCLVSISQDGL